jgi:hypothetical protein
MLNLTKHFPLYTPENLWGVGAPIAQTEQNYINFSYFSPHKKSRKKLTQSACPSKHIIVQKFSILEY